MTTRQIMGHSDYTAYKRLTALIPFHEFTPKQFTY